MKIDCHTHLVNPAIRDEYFSKTDGYALVMAFLEKFEDFAPPDSSLALVQEDPRLFWCPAIDIHRELTPQLKAVEERLNDTRIVGLKVYLTYQKGRADDPALFPIYAFAEEHQLSVTFHTGSCSLVLPTDNDMDGCNARYVRNAALAFPKVNFILAHMDDPRYDECIRIVHETENLFTDFSGAYEPGTHEGEDINWAIATFKKAIDQFPDTYRKILYGTDFCPPINLSAVAEFDTTIRGIFSEDRFEDIYCNNALRAFPRLRNYLKGE
ncbi:MAG: amidohydrolase [Clostridia bacterium]|nr:amidohydrolase [Clostridia bacterium]